MLGAERGHEGNSFGVDGSGGHGGGASDYEDVGCGCEKSGRHGDGWQRMRFGVLWVGVLVGLIQSMAENEVVLWFE